MARFITCLGGAQTQMRLTRQTHNQYGNLHFSLQGASSGGANVIYHAAGWLEGGLSASMEKFIIDCEMLQQIVYSQKAHTFFG